MEEGDCPVEIKSVQFKETTVQSGCELDDLRPELGEIIFVDYDHHSSQEFIDVMLKDKVFKYQYYRSTAYRYCIHSLNFVQFSRLDTSALRWD